MPLEAETKAVVSQFDLNDRDVNAATLEFLRQAGKLSGCATTKFDLFLLRRFS